MNPRVSVKGAAFLDQHLHRYLFVSLFAMIPTLAEYSDTESWFHCKNKTS